MLTRDEVVWGYRYIFGREPEDEVTLNSHAMAVADWRQFRLHLLRSHEFAGLYGSTLPEFEISRWFAAPVFSGQRTIWLNLDDRYVSMECLHGVFEQDETNLVRELLKPDHVFFDIGANIGWFTFFASTILGEAGRIHAFEPCRPVVDYLRGAVAMNRLESMIQVHDFGLDRDEGAGLLGWEPETHNPGHSYLVDTASAGVETQPVQLKSLDHLGLGRVDVIKIDVEGAELRIFQGAQQTLEENRPVILAELFPEQLQKVSGASVDDFFCWFKARNYTGFLVRNGRADEQTETFPQQWPSDHCGILLRPGEV